MGRIIKNRSGSMKKARLEEIFEEGMNVHLKILTFFFDIIKQNDVREETIIFIQKRLNVIIEKKESENKKPTIEQLQKIAEIIFWNLSFQVTNGFINKIICSLGSDSLIHIVTKVCDRINTPASFLVKHGILIWYSKNLQIENIATYIRNGGFSKIAMNILIYRIVDYCSLHKIGYKDLDRIVKEFGIKKQNMMKLKYKNKKVGRNDPCSCGSGKKFKR